MTCRGVRGATIASENTPAAILEATRELLAEMAAENQIEASDLASAIFTATPDLSAAYPAEAARQLGWSETPLLCMQDMLVPGSLERCIRVLLHWNTERPAGAIVHIYRNGAEVLRPDWAAQGVAMERSA